MSEFGLLQVHQTHDVIARLAGVDGSLLRAGAWAEKGLDRQSSLELSQWDAFLIKSKRERRVQYHRSHPASPPTKAEGGLFERASSLSYVLMTLAGDTIARVDGAAITFGEQHLQV